VTDVKSAVRTLALLEYLRQCRPSTLGEIARGLEMPMSSAAALLKTLTRSGYLSFSAADRTYRASYRVALLGESVEEKPSVGPGPLLEQLQALRQQTGETVIVGLQNGAFLQYVHVIAAQKKLLQRLPIGKMRLMGYNPMGRILLAHLDRGRAVSILRHNNANWSDSATRLSQAELLESVDEARRTGYSLGPGLTWPNASIIALTIRPSEAAPTMAVAVGGMSATILPRVDEVLAAMRTLLSPWLESPGEVG
jgi:DNA-binding IclR family transcriptional regulator